MNNIEQALIDIEQALVGAADWFAVVTWWLCLFGGLLFVLLLLLLLHSWGVLRIALFDRLFRRQIQQSRQAWQKYAEQPTKSRPTLEKIEE